MNVQSMLKSSSPQNAGAAGCVCNQYAINNSSQVKRFDGSIPEPDHEPSRSCKSRPTHASKAQTVPAQICDSKVENSDGLLRRGGDG